MSDYYYVGGFYGNASVQVPDEHTGVHLHYLRARARACACRATRLQQRAGDAIGAGSSGPCMRIHLMRVNLGDAKGAGGSRPFCRRTRRAVRPLPLPVWCFSRLHGLSSHA